MASDGFEHSYNDAFSIWYDAVFLK
jgi:hypothetical protein